MLDSTFSSRRRRKGKKTILFFSSFFATNTLSVNQLAIYRKHFDVLECNRSDRKIFHERKSFHENLFWSNS